MAVTLKRSLFIGLGGTGATALLHTKKRFLDTYGEIPPMIEFLVIDTDRNTKDKTLERDTILEIHKVQESNVSLDNSEVIHTSVSGATDIYNRNKNTFLNWLPQENEHVLRNLDIGSGQVRSNGRFSVFVNSTSVQNAVQKKIDNIMNLAITANNRFIAKGNGVEINFVYSIAGGTGSGSFLDIAYIVKNSLRGFMTNYTAFMVLPDVFNTMQTGVSMKNTMPNSYGALKELDYVMQKNVHKKNLSIKLGNGTIEIDSNPFDIVFTINNKNTSGQTISHISDISEQIGLALFTGASELSANVDSVYDNVKAVLAGGNLDIEDKRAWACGMGVSELFYDGNLLSNVYARRVQVNMIESFLGKDIDMAQSIANDFIDSDNVSIRENNNQDFLIDSLLSSRPNYLFSFDSDDDYENEIASHINYVTSNAAEIIKKNYIRKFEATFSELEERLDKTTNSYNGIGNSEHFLHDLKDQLQLFLDEMKEEEREFKEKQITIKQSIDESLKSLNSLRGNINRLFKGGEIKDLKQSLSDAVNTQSEYIHEVERRVYAQRFFNKLIEEVTRHQNRIAIIKGRLEQVRDQARTQANKFANEVNNKQKLFVIDLHKKDLSNTFPDKNNHIIVDFLNSLEFDNKILDYDQTSVKIINQHFWNFAKDLPQSKTFVNKTIDEALSNSTDEDKILLAKELIGKSKSLWQKSTLGYKLQNVIFDYFVVGLPSADSTFKSSFQSLIDSGSRIEFVVTGVKNKITCYRMEAAVPIFGVGGVKGYEQDHTERIKNSDNIRYYIDYNWNTQIEREKFSIWPTEQEDNSLEAWVLGFVYNLIRFNKTENKYEVYSEELGNPLSGSWFSLDGYRDSSFNTFKVKNIGNEIQELVQERVKLVGNNAANELLRDVKENYMTKYSQSNLDVETLLNKKEYANIANLLKSEIKLTKTLI